MSKPLAIFAAVLLLALGAGAGWLARGRALKLNPWGDSPEDWGAIPLDRPRYQFWSPGVPVIYRGDTFTGEVVRWDGERWVNPYR
jgi:hypothetical protein